MNAHDRERFAMAIGREFYRVAREEFKLSETQAQRLRLHGRESAEHIIEADERFHHPCFEEP